MIPHSRPTLGPEDCQALLEVIESGQLSQGPRVAAFEEAVASRLGRRGGVAVSSGTAALALALAALGIGPGDEVLLPAYACSALGDAVRFVGAAPVLADVGPDLALAPDQAARRLCKRTRAVVVVHPFGHPVDVEPFLAMGPAVIEDSAQALGAVRDGVPAGGRGAAAVCSFYATKPVAVGEGGMILADDDAVLQASREFRRGGGRGKGFNFKLSDLAAALGLAQLGRLDAFVARRRHIARRYDAAFARVPLRTPPADAAAEASYARYVVRAPDAARFVERLARSGVEAKPPVGDPLFLSYEVVYPEAIRAFAECASLPIYPSLTEAELDRVVESVLQAVSEGSVVW